MKLKLFGVIVISSALFFACSQNDELVSTDYSEDVLKSATLAVNDMVVENAAEESSYEVSFFAESEQLLRMLSLGQHGNILKWQSGLRYKNGQCPSVSIDSSATDTGYPLSITLDYDDSTALKNGRVLSGIINIEISAARHTDGAMRTVTYNQFKVDSVEVEGTFTERFIGDNANSRKTVETSDLIFTLADGSSIERKAVKTREWLSGIDTPLVASDDSIQVTGEVTAITFAGVTYSKLITQPLIKIGECKYYIQGEVTISQNGSVVSVLNYGDGTCDNVATLTTDGETVEIDLKGTKPDAKTKGNGHKAKGKH